MSEGAGSLRVAELKAAMSLVGQIARMTPSDNARGDSDSTLALNALIAIARGICSGSTEGAQSATLRQCNHCLKQRACSLYELTGPLGSRLGQRWFCLDCCGRMRRIFFALESK